MVFLASRGMSGTNTIFRTNDTDVLIILLANEDDFPNDINLWWDMWINSNNNRRLTEVNSLHQKLGKNICNTLPGLYALTGSDYTTSFLRKGKLKPLKL